MAWVYNVDYSGGCQTLAISPILQFLTHFLELASCQKPNEPCFWFCKYNYRKESMASKRRELVSFHFHQYHWSDRLYEQLRFTPLLSLCRTTLHKGQFVVAAGMPTNFVVLSPGLDFLSLFLLFFKLHLAKCHFCRSIPFFYSLLSDLCFSTYMHRVCSWLVKAFGGRHGKHCKEQSGIAGAGEWRWKEWVMSICIWRKIV